MDRIEFEEWSLKAIDPAIAPKPWSELSNDADEKAYAKSGQKLERVEFELVPVYVMLSNSLKPLDVRWLDLTLLPSCIHIVRADDRNVESATRSSRTVS